MGYEADAEATPLTAAEEAELLALALVHDREAMAEIEAARSQDELFYALPGATIGAFRLGDAAHAKALAKQALDLAMFYEKNWNYGNAIHYAHTTLGLLALEGGDRSAAVAELLQAGATPGSPQLDSFGPTMQLARSLLRTGESQAVLEYLAQCRVFWKMGETWINLWESKIRAGGLPNFAMALYR
jgi:hypothetical protein